VKVKDSEEENIQIIEGCIKGDRRSQKDLYRTFYGLSLSICARYAVNKEDAAGILNEGFYKVFVNIKKYDFQRPFASWLSKIMTNTAIDFYRSNLRFSNDTDIADHTHSIADPETILSKLHYDDLLAMIRKLPPAYRTVFNLYAVDGYGHQEIGDLLGITIGTSKSNLHKARMRLAEMVRSAEKSSIFKFDEGA